jgi:hypothetical protein
MRLNYKGLTGLICIVIGIALIIYAEYGMHHHVEVTKSWLDKIKDFFIHIGDVITGKAEKPTVPDTHALKRIFISGIVLTCFGILMVLFGRLKKKS